MGLQYLDDLMKIIEWIKQVEDYIHGLGGFVIGFVPFLAFTERLLLAFLSGGISFLGGLLFKWIWGKIKCQSKIQ